MNIDEAFDQIAVNLKLAKKSGIEPSIRVSEPDWVCTTESKQTKFIIIAKEEQLMLVNMKSIKGPPDVQRIQVPEYTQQSLIERIEKTIIDIYGVLPAK